MAVIQISKIQVRRGLQENLPQLASGEMGWSVDAQRLYIGNGTLTEGAPSLGRTEILTELSDIQFRADYANVLVTLANLEADIDSVVSDIDNLNQLFAVNTYVIDPDTSGNIANISISSLGATLDYNISRDDKTRTGSIKVTQFDGNAVFNDDYVENDDTGVVIDFTGVGNLAVMSFTSDDSGNAATLSYYIRSFI
jgi:hypothetical protein